MSTFNLLTINEVKNNNHLCSCWERADHTALSGMAVQACWWWLLQMWKFWQFACSQNVFNVFARWHQCLWFKRWEFKGIGS